jgi:hypothetical protein
MPRTELEFLKPTRLSSQWVTAAHALHHRFGRAA